MLLGLHCAKIGGDSTAYSMSMSVKPGDVLSLLRAVRAFYERRAIPHQTQLRKELIRISISDYPDVKHYIAALELIFNKLAALGDVISDQVRRFHLIEGLSDEYHSVVSSVMAYEGPHGAQADYAKAVQIISSYEESFISRRRKGIQETTMAARATSRRGSLGDAPARAHGGGDARPRSAKELCVYFLKGKCTRGTRCRFGHLQPFNKGGDRRVFTTKNSSNRHHGNNALRNKRPANRQPSTCFSCGQPGHLKKDCRKRNNDRANVAFDFALPAVEVSTSSPAPAQQEMTQDNVNMADGRQSDRISCWLIDGGASCHVVGFDPGAALQNRRRATIEILVGGGQRIKCEHVGDLTVVVKTSNPRYPE